MPATSRSRSDVLNYLHRVSRPILGARRSPWRAVLRRALRGVDRRPTVEMYMDVVGTCNLRCPSCPVGNTSPTSGTGLLDVDLFSQIMAKAAQEYRVTGVSLFNWTEPMIHPRLPEFVRAVHKHGIQCFLSSNLNLLRDPDAIFAEAPEHFRISLSGFTQETYGVTHAAGNIEKVKKNMRLLSESKRRVGNKTTQIQVYYHRYLNNIDEASAMKAYALSLGFTWLSNWAYLMPIEKAIDLAEGRLPPGDVRFMESQFALPIPEALVAARRVRDAPCRLLRDQLVLDLNGNVVVCCGVYDVKANTLGNFLAMSVDDFAKAKQGHPTCDKCMSHGIHKYVTYYEDQALARIYDGLAEARIAGNVGAKALRSLPIVA
jgi:pyruvate-formate lyase-activating enzyme